MDTQGGSSVMSIFETRGGELAVVAAQWSLSWLESGPSGASRFRSVRPNLPRPMLESSRSRWEILQDHAGD